MSYEFSRMATEAGKAKYDSIKVSAKPGTSFSGFRKSAQTVRTAILKKKDDVNGVVKEIVATYSSAVANPKVNELRAEYKQDVTDKKIKLSEGLKAIVDGKKKAVERFTVLPPADEFFRIYKAYEVRTADTISNTEWQYLIDKAGDNYLSLRMVQQLANKFDRSFVMPFDPDDTLKKLDELSTVASLAIEYIDVPDNELADSRVDRFYNMDGENGRTYDPYFGELIATLDTSAGVVIPEEYRSISKRLNDAREKAYNNDNVELSAKIRVFMEKYADQLQTPEELKELVYQRAEELITQANATDKPTT